MDCRTVVCRRTDRFKKQTQHTICSAFAFPVFRFFSQISCKRYRFSFRWQLGIKDSMNKFSYLISRRRRRRRHRPRGEENGKEVTPRLLILPCFFFSTFVCWAFSCVCALLKCVWPNNAVKLYSNLIGHEHQPDFSGLNLALLDRIWPTFCHGKPMSIKVSWGDGIFCHNWIRSGSTDGTRWYFTTLFWLGKIALAWSRSLGWLILNFSWNNGEKKKFLLKERRRMFKHPDYAGLRWL